MDLLLRTERTAYEPGVRETRPWGQYVVTALRREGADEICEKEVTIAPGRMLSLQSHEMREERWLVARGVLHVVLDGAVHVLVAGEEITVPRGAIHSMANLSAVPVLVQETARGVECREDDIVRYTDMAGRLCIADARATVRDSVAVYERLLAEMTG